MTVSYRELFTPQKEETRTGEEIRESIKNKLRNIGVKNGRIDSESDTNARQISV